MVQHMIYQHSMYTWKECVFCSCWEWYSLNVRYIKLLDGFVQICILIFFFVSYSLNYWKMEVKLQLWLWIFLFLSLVLLVFTTCVLKIVIWGIHIWYYVFLLNASFYHYETSFFIFTNTFFEVCQKLPAAGLVPFLLIRFTFSIVFLFKACLTVSCQRSVFFWVFAS